MLRFVTARLATSGLLLVATSIFVFVTLRLLPGDPVLTRLGEQSTVSPEVIAKLRADLDLDQPIVVQYASWFGNALRGDFGLSYFSQYPVSTMISSRIEPTLQLALLALVATVIISVPVAVLCAMRPRGIFDRIATFGTSLGMSMPQFLLGIVLVLVFSVWLGILPSRGFVSFAESPGQNLLHMILPATTLALVSAPILIRFLRTSMVEALGSSYVRTARGKGVSNTSVVTGHVLKNTLIPALTVVGVMVGNMLGGAVIIEYVFGFSGLGSLVIEAVSKRDYAIVQAVALLVSALFILTSLAVDLLYGVLDPRLRIRRIRG